MRGSVKWFDSAKRGYGFIGQDGGKEDIFLHISELRKSGIENIATGQIVDFDVVQSSKGKPVAANIKIVG